MIKNTVVLFLLMTFIVSAKQTKNHAYQSCGLDRKSQKLAQLVVEAKGQLRKTLVCNQALAEAANKKAKQMAESGKVAHYINHISPNELLNNAGIELPFNYDKIGNQVEAVSGGMRTSKKAFQHFLTSETHKSHLLGEEEFYLSQNHIGVGHYRDKNKNHVDYWVVFITELRSDGDKPQSILTVTPDKPKIAKRVKKKKRYRSLNTLVN